MAREKITCTADTWVLIADGVTTGAIIVDKWQPSNYIFTWVAHSEAAPTDEATAAPLSKREMLITSASSIDIYVKCKININGVFLDGSVFYDTSQIYGVAGVTYLNIDVQEARELWFGKSADQSGNDWASENSLIAFEAVSGNNEFGITAYEEAKVIGTLDTPIVAGTSEFKISKILFSLAFTDPTIIILRIIWGTETSADALISNQYVSIMFRSTTTWEYTSEMPVFINMPKIANGNKIWVQCKSELSGETICFFVGIQAI